VTVSEQLAVAVQALKRVISEPEDAKRVAELAIGKILGRHCLGCGVYFETQWARKFYHNRACNELARQKRYWERQIQLQDKLKRGEVR
jgi:hypothetical protein